MEYGLFLLGMLGALLTVYLAKQEVIPEFRPLFDTSGKETEAMDHRDHIKKTARNIDKIQARLETESLTDDTVTQLTVVINSSQEELRLETIRLQKLEREIKQNQIFSRGTGFIIYIVLGGLFGFLLAGKVQIEGLSGDLPNYFESIVIGATWTSYLSVIGFSQVGKKVDEKIEIAKKQIIETVTMEAENTGQPLSTDVLITITEKFDRARMVIQKDVKGIL